MPPLRQDNTQPAPPPTPPPAPRMIDDFVMGIRFFSRLPTGGGDHEMPHLNRMTPAVPFVSLAIAFLPALLMMGLCWLGAPPLFAAAFGIGAMAVATGAMPEDALADSMDGLFGGATIERRLEIMKDSRHGTYGVVAIGLYLILRITALGTVAAVNPLAAGALMIATSLIARSGSLWLSVELPPAREGGASASVGRVGMPHFIVSAAFVAVLSFVLAGPFVTLIGVLLALLAATLTAIAWIWTCRRLIGGQSGDLIGALHALIEVAVLTIFMLFA